MKTSRNYFIIVRNEEKDAMEEALELAVKKVKGFNFTMEKRLGGTFKFTLIFDSDPRIECAALYALRAYLNRKFGIVRAMGHRFRREIYIQTDLSQK